MASDIAVEFADVSASRGGRRVLHDVSLVVARRRDRRAGRPQRSGQDHAAPAGQPAARTRRRRRCIVDGRDAREWDPIALRRQTGYVIQDVGLFPHMTVGGNIAIVPRLLDVDRRRASRRASTSCWRWSG